VPESSNPPLDQNFPEVPLCDDIMEFVNEQKTARKRKSNETNDISERIGPAAKQLRFGEEENGEQQENISSFDNQANVDNEIVPPADVTEPLQVSNETFNVAELELPVIAAKQKPKKKSKLVVDKVTKITENVLKSNRKNYEEKFTVQSPLDTFMMRLMHCKRNEFDVMSPLPASRMKNSSSLLPIYQRNLKRIPLKLQKRPVEEVVEDEVEVMEQRSSRKKRKVTNEKPKKPKFQILEDIMLPPLDMNEFVNLPLIDLPSMEDQNNNIPEINDQNNIDLPLIDESYQQFNLPSAQKKNQRKSRTKTSDEYKPTEKWSKEQIVNKLSKFWKKKDCAVTMTKLCAKTNRFIAAGIFFELMCKF
jgi:hypothetical protein